MHCLTCNGGMSICLSLACFIDGVEQTDTAQYSKRAKEREAMNAWLARHVEESEVSNAD